MMASSEDFKSMLDEVQAAVVAVVRTSSQVAASDLSFQRSNDQEVDEQVDDSAERLLSLATSLMGSATKGTNFQVPTLEDSHDVDIHWSRVVDVIDGLLEKADTCLDEYTGLVRRKSEPTGNDVQPKKGKHFTQLNKSMRRANVLKPQNTFDVKVDNLDTSPWKPILSSKPHAVQSLEESLETFVDENNSVQYGIPTCGGRYKHPYEVEIRQMQYPKSVYEKKEPVMYQPIESTAATFVDTFDGVLVMLEELKKAKEIAIDTEHHDYRTYTGLLSLMQISTRDRDWIVDTLQPWRHRLEVLNEVFADPSILKVLHGAYMDIIWLQRDLGLYVVGLFDTYEAAVSLQYPMRSLASLLKRFVDFDADKKYQLADWRLRPIPDEMLFYARADTHFLLFVYDKMRNELIARSGKTNPPQDLVTHVLQESTETSLRRYERTAYDADSGRGSCGWYNMLLKQSAAPMSPEQFSIFRAVHKWRDEAARREDESPLFILGNANVFDIAKRLPPDPMALHSILDAKASRFARQSVTELFNVVKQAKLEGANGPSVGAFFRDNKVGIGGVTKQVPPVLESQGNGNAVPQLHDMVAKTSQLWGSMPISSRWEESSQTKRAAANVTFQLPWAKFVESAWVGESVTLPERLASQQSDAPAKPALAAEDGTEEFTLRGGVKRQRPDATESAGSKSVATASLHAGDEIARGDNSEPSSAMSQKTAGRRAAKNAAHKKAKRKRHQADQSAGDRDAGLAPEGQRKDNHDQVPFDYSKADSVLAGKRSATKDVDGQSEKGGKKKVFNPYSSLSAEGPKPARKMHGEKPGLSGTFR